MLFGLAILYLFLTHSTHYGLLVLVMMGYYAVNVLFNLVFYCRGRTRGPGETVTYRAEMLHSIGCLIFYTGAYLFLSGAITWSGLVGFWGGYLVFVLARLCHDSTILTLMSGRFFIFMEAIQILIIVTRLSSGVENQEWTTSLIYLYIILSCWFAFSLFLMLVGSIILLVLLCNFGAHTPLQLKIFFVMFALGFAMTWQGPVFFFLLIGFQRLATEQGIGPSMKPGGINMFLLGAGAAMAACSLLSLIGIFCFYKYVRDLLLANLSQSHTRQLSLTTFTTALNLNVVPVSENFMRNEQPENLP